MTPYLVYYHKDPDTGEIVYVGHGSQDRPWQFHNRDINHKKWLKSKLKDGHTLADIVVLTYTHVSAEEAKRSELYLIDLHRPIFNKNYDFPTVFTEDTFGRAKDLRKSGLSYEKIAIELGVSVMTVHRAINGKVKAHDKWS